MSIVKTFGRLLGCARASQAPAPSGRNGNDTRRSAVRQALFLLVFMGLSYQEAQADQIRGLVTIGMQRVFEEVRPAFETVSGRTFDVQFASTPDIANRIQAGEAADFIIL